MFKNYRDYFLNFLTSLSYLISQVAILFYFSKYIGIEETGYYSMSIAITAPLFMLTNFQLKWVLATEKISKFTNISSYFHFRFLSSLISLIALLIYICFCSGDFKFQYIFILVLLTKYFESLSDLNYGYLQLHESYLPLLFSIAIKSFVTLVSIFFDYYFFRDYKVLLFVNAFSYLLFFIYEFRKHVKINYAIDSFINNIKLIFFKYWKFAILSFFYSLRINLPRFILGQISVISLGVFSTLSYLNYGSNFIFGSLSEVSNVKIKLERKLNPILILILKFCIFSLLYSITVYLTLFFFKDQLFNLLFKNLPNISDFTINLVLLNGFLLNVILVLDNMYMIFRFKNHIVILVILESLALLIILFLSKNKNLDNILIVQNFITFCFIFITGVVFIKAFNKQIINKRWD
jgi:O-antigen/teichoic acid export membrane protein